MKLRLHFIIYILYATEHQASVCIVISTVVSKFFKLLKCCLHVLGVIQLQGEVIQFNIIVAGLNVTGNSTFAQFLSYNASNRMAVVSGLQANSLYVVNMTMAMYGGANIACSPAFVRTIDGSKCNFLFLTKNLHLNENLIVDNLLY